MHFGGNAKLSQVRWVGRTSCPTFQFNAPHLDSIQIECDKAVIEELNCPMLTSFKLSCQTLQPKEVGLSFASVDFRVNSFRPDCGFVDRLAQFEGADGGGRHWFVTATEGKAGCDVP